MATPTEQPKSDEISRRKVLLVEVSRVSPAMTGPIEHEAESARTAEVLYMQPWLHVAYCMPRASLFRVSTLYNAVVEPP